jgi:hypothetical protein
MRFTLRALLGGVLALAVACGSVWAQATAQISGTVQDPSGAVLPGAEVTATQTDTGVVRMTVTNETGSYVLPNLTTGPYRLEATLPGFRTLVQTGIVLQVNSNPTVNIVLQVGQVSEQVEVQANVAQVETRSTSVGQVMENERILELPLAGRQVTNLITLSGGAVQTGQSTSSGTWAHGIAAGTYISVAGGLDFGVMYALDGVMHSSPYDGTAMPFPFPDALQEFKIDVSGMGAAGGTRGSGGQVNAVTKSGTNEIHGDAFEFVRNYDFNARNFFALQRDTLKRNQFGGTLGGPLVKNRFFFFGGYQATLTRADGTPQIEFIPTAAMLAGDWTTFTSPGCNGGRQITLGAPFINNRINPALYSKPALNIVAKLPKPLDDCGTVNYFLPQRSNENQFVGKVDYQQSAKHSMFVRYVATTYKAPHPFTASGGNVLALSSTQGAADDLAQSYALGSTYLISPNSVNAFRIAWNRTRLDRPNTPTFSAPEIGVNAYTYTDRTMSLAVTGGFSFGTRAATENIVTNGYQVGDDLNYVRGKHQFTVGGNLANWRAYQRCLVQADGVYSFNGVQTGLGMGDFLTGNLTTLTQSSPAVDTTVQWYVGSYVQDVWKASPKLTLNAGLRWEPYLPLNIGHGIGMKLNEGVMYNFSDDRFSKGLKSTVFPNAPAGLLYPGDPGFPNGAPNYKQWAKFAPRVGFAWDVRGDGRTSIRAAFGLAYDFSGMQTLSGSGVWAPPYGLSTVVQSPSGGFADPWSDFPGGNPFPYVRLSRFPQFPQFYYVKRFDSSEPTVQNWNLTIQRQLPASVLLTVSYVGSQSYHLWVRGDVNRAVYFPGAPVNGICTVGTYVLQNTGTTCSTTANTDKRRRLLLQNPQEGQYYGNMSDREDSGTASYHGLLLSVQRRAARGLNVSGNYTWSHCVGNDPTANGTGLAGAGYLDLNNRNFDRGNCGAVGSTGAGISLARRQIFNLTAVASTPQFANSTMRMLGTGWQLSTIYGRSSGGFYTVSTGLDRLLDGQAGAQRPVQILGDPYLSRNSLKYLNPQAFAQPALGTIGNMGIYNIEGPGTWDLDLGLSRIFTPREGQKLEFRAEAFNVTNSLRMGNPNLTLNSNIFGQINTALDARVMQFALKYSF